MGQGHSNHDNSSKSSKSRLHWMSGLASAGACIVVKIRHPRGLPRGAARMLARWVRRGSASFPSRAHLQEALTRHGSTLDCSVKLDHTEFCVNTADWRWGLSFLLDILARPVLDDDIYEDLQLESDEEWRAPTTDLWLARAWGWVDTDTTPSAAHLRGVWEHLYTFQYIQLSIGGAIPRKVPADLHTILRDATHSAPPTHRAPPVAWTPPPPAAAAGPEQGTHVATRLAPQAEARAVLTLAFSMPPRMTWEMRQCIGLVLEDLFGAACRDCSSWSQGVRCAWHAMGDSALLLALECTVRPDVNVTGFAQQAAQLIRGYSLPAASVARAYGAVQKRRHVRCTHLAGAVRQATEESPLQRTPEQMHGAAQAVFRENLLPGPRATCLAVHARRKNAALCQRAAAAPDASCSYHKKQSVGGAHALCPPSPNTSKTIAQTAVRV